MCITGSYLCLSGKSEINVTTNHHLIIRYNTESNKWIALSEKSPDFMASSEVSGPSLLLGPQVGKYLKTKKYFDFSDENQAWLISNDSAACSGQAASYTARLSLSACQGGRQSGQTGPLSLVEVCRGCALIGWNHHVADAMPALLMP